MPSSQRPINVSKPKPVRTSGIRFIAVAAALAINCGVATNTLPRRARNQPNSEIRTADRPDQEQPARHLHDLD
jgi:hypothetical protein